jgi:LacI family transcriptional regulator
VPGKVAVIAVATDEIVCELSTPPLTTILQDARKIGQESAAMLDMLLRGRALKNQRIIVSPLGIKVRTSTDIIATEDPYLVKALGVIRERFRDKLDVDDICGVLKISRRAFEERFRLALGRSPYEEIMRTRIRHAETLLAQTSDTNLTIALESGFASERRLDENFRNVTGMSPGEYRRKFAGSS